MRTKDIIKNYKTTNFEELNEVLSERFLKLKLNGVFIEYAKYSIVSDRLNLTVNSGNKNYDVTYQNINSLLSDEEIIEIIEKQLDEKILLTDRNYANTRKEMLRYNEIKNSIEEYVKQYIESLNEEKGYNVNLEVFKIGKKNKEIQYEIRCKVYDKEIYYIGIVKLENEHYLKSVQVLLSENIMLKAEYIKRKNRL